MNSLCGDVRAAVDVDARDLTGFDHDVDVRRLH
jgi:hypothetical protein